MAKQYRTKTYTIANTSDGREKLKKLRRDIDNRQNNTTSTLFNILLNIAGLFNVGFGIAATAFSGAESGNAAYLEYLEDMYTSILEDFVTGNGDLIKYTTVTQKFVGEDGGGEHGVMWKAQKPTYKHTYKYYG